MFRCSFDAIPGYYTNEVWLWDFVFFQLSGGRSRILWLQRNRLSLQGKYLHVHDRTCYSKATSSLSGTRCVPLVSHRDTAPQAIASQCGYLDTGFWHFYSPLPKCTQCWGFLCILCANFWGQICFKASGLCMLLFWYEGCWNILLLEVCDNVLYLGCSEL